MAGDGDAERHRLERRRDLLDQLAGALIGLLGAVREHRAAVLVDDLDIEALFGLLDHNVLGGLGNLRHFLQSLPQRGGSEREFLILLEVRTVICLLYTSPSPRDGLLSRMP